jgi:hypothetical protein
MKIYKISREKCDWGTYRGAIVVAENESLARKTYPDDGLIYDNFSAFNDWVSDPSEIIVEYIGEAAEGLTAGVLLSDFAAG